MKCETDDKIIPMIVFTKYAPYTAVNVETIMDGAGRVLPHQPVVSLCRCGRSEKKPFCDGSHADKGICGEKRPDRIPDRVKDYPGKNITVHYNRGICSHDGACINLLPEVFNVETRPWIAPDAAPAEDIIRIIEKCPSGALSYTIGQTRYNGLDRPPAIRAADDGPFEVTGGITIKDDMGSVPGCGEHYTLCRCGESKNAPFCDGSHVPAGFRG